MRFIENIKRASIAALPAIIILAVSSPVVPQTKLQTNPGGYHGEMDFLVNWKQYYDYAGRNKILHDIREQYSHLADIESIGKSRMGRDQYLMTITTKATGDHTEKSAIWIDGAIHGNEYNGVTCALYVIWYLLTRYDYDKYVHDLVDNYTFYVLAGYNVDGHESFVNFPNTPNNPREPYRPEDNDGDGLYDEDRTEDVDGDGELSIMYREDPMGNFKLSNDGRRFIAVENRSEKVTKFSRIGSEGFDNDGDGRINEDDIGGPDPNRNFPYGWSLGSGWPYPLSENMTRNVYNAQLARPNIYATLHYHNTGRLIMFQAPPAVQRETPLTREQREQRQEETRQRLEELRRTNRYAQLFDREIDPDYQNDMDTQLKIVTTGARLLKNYRPTIAGLSGQQHAATYYMFGAFSYLVELWGSPTFEADQNGDGRLDDEEYLMWIDLELNGEGWVEPHKVNHPDLGPIWIGGTRKKHTVRTPPARYMEMEALKNTQFALYIVSQFPKVEIEDITVIPETGDLFWVDVTLKNDRVYPTVSDRRIKLENAVMDKLQFNGSNNISLVPIPEGNVSIAPDENRSSVESVNVREKELRLFGNETRRFRYLVKMDGSSGWIEFTILSKFGGTDTERITLKVSN